MRNIRQKKGFTLVEIMVTVAIIVILALISIPNLLRARCSTKETLAATYLKTISTAMVGYKMSNSSFMGLNLLALSTATPAYVDPLLGSGKRDGYNFVLTPVSKETYVCVATPESPGVSGVRSFCVTEDGVVREQAVGGAIADHSVCLSLPPTGP